MGLRIRKGDRVKVLAGKDKGKTGKVIIVYPSRNRALVEHVNMVKKFFRKSQKYPNGAIVEQEALIHLSNLAVMSPVSGKPTRLKTSVAADGSKERVSAKEKAVIA